MQFLQEKLLTFYMGGDNIASESKNAITTIL